MENISQCQICGESEFSEFLKCTDHFLTKENFTIVKCNYCGFTFINPRPEPAALQRYYDSPEYISHSGTNKGIINSLYNKVRNYTHNKKIKIVSEYSKGKTILDIGCGSGELLNLFNKHNWETLGVEPNSNARNFANAQYGIEVLDEHQINEIPSSSKDVITMWHVLEHVAGLNERMAEVKRILKDNGVVLIAVPNRISFDATYYGEFWAAYDVPRHLYHFTPDSIKKLFEKHGFSLIKTLPMKFDSYYVSMLSEKYKTGKNKLLKALHIGLRSNLKARKNKNSYSSLIYIIKNS